MATPSRFVLPGAWNNSSIKALQFNLSGTLLAIAAEDGGIRVWSMVSQRVVVSCDLSAAANCLSWECITDIITQPHFPLASEFRLIAGLNNGGLVRISFHLNATVNLYLLGPLLF